MSDIIELRCSNCATTEHVNVYDPVIDVLYRRYGLYTGAFFEHLYPLLKPCKCGGHFSVSASYRRRKCNATITLNEIKKQIGYKGSTPGIAMDNIVDNSKESIWTKQL